MQLVAPATIVVASMIGLVPATCATTSGSHGGLSFTGLAADSAGWTDHVAVPIGTRLCSASNHLQLLTTDDTLGGLTLRGPVTLDGEWCLNFDQLGTATIDFGLRERPRDVPIATRAFGGSLLVEVVPLEDLEFAGWNPLEQAPPPGAMSATGEPLPTDLGAIPEGESFAGPGRYAWPNLPLWGITAHGLPVLLEPEQVVVEVDGFSHSDPDDPTDVYDSWVVDVVEGGSLTLAVETSAGRKELHTVIGATEDDIASLEVVAWSTPMFPRDQNGDYPTWMHGFREPTLLQVVRGLARDHNGRPILRAPWKARNLDVDEMVDRLHCAKPSERFGEYEAIVELTAGNGLRAKAPVRWGIDPRLHDAWLEAQFGDAYDSLEAWETEQSFSEFVDDGFQMPADCTYEPPVLPGCGCSSTTSPAGLAPLTLLGLLLFWRRRR